MTGEKQGCELRPIQKLRLGDMIAIQALYRVNVRVMSDPAASPARLPICPKKGSLAGRAAGSLITYNCTCTLSLSVDQCGGVKMKSSVSLLCGRLCLTEKSTSMVFDASPLFYKAFNTTAGCRGWRWVSRWQQIHDDSFIDDGLQTHECHQL